jgi:DNA-binding transcriptional LysR family regulator
MVIVVAAEHPWADNPNIDLIDLTKTDWVMREPGSGTRMAFEEALTGFGIALSSLRIVMELPSNEAIRAAVEAGMGAAALSASVAAPSIEAGLTYSPKLMLPERSFHVLQHSERYESNAGRALLEVIAGRRRRGKLLKAADSEYRENKIST